MFRLRMHRLQPSILLRIAGGFLVIILLLAASTLITMHSSRTTMIGVDRMTTSANPILHTTGTLDLELSQLSELFQLHQASNERAVMPDLQDDFELTRTRIGAESDQLLAYLDDLGETSAQVSMVQRFDAQIAQLVQRMRQLMMEHQDALGRVDQIRQRRDEITTLEADISHLFEDLVWSLPDDEAVAIALEFYASFLHGLMLMKDIDIADQADVLERLDQAFGDWEMQHNNQFFAFTGMVARQPETQQLVQTVDELTEQMVQGTRGHDDQPGLISLRAQAVASQARYSAELADLTADIEQAKLELTALNQFAERFARETNQQVAANLARTLNLSLASLLASILLGGLISALIIRSIRQPMQRLTRSLSHLGEGDLTWATQGHRRDEMGVLEGSVEQVRQSLLDMIQSIRGQSERLRQQAEGGRNLAETMRDRTAEQSRETDSIASSMQEMATTVGAVNTSAREGMNHADEALQEIDVTVAAVQQNRESLTALKERVIHAEAFTGELSGRMADIESVSEVIRDIAEQTNLLALNAAIEAARAGEHGRGFAVVADEVRSLASRTQSSTTEIRATVEGLLAGHRELAETMRYCLQGVGDSHAVAADSADAMLAFRDRMGQINHISQQISVTTTEQGTTAEDITRRVTRIADIARANEQLSVEARDAAAVLGDLTAELETLVQRFRIQ
ncbi:methyl-accepting chemotaxis protein [Natronospirillum operosum]|uniref:Methyl-accepting chemotaxis protein n=1 Tax=Natronospirillum operosum TaxID=2759953 RepID=A0A4Z0WHG4_9GAMM|nr:methyl-accepting chemotaxis protein [Natronospirillum operosum]TGG94238.1 methyl-accepting chemotaxis protein [Natronospirillum operosum]